MLLLGRQHARKEDISRIIADSQRPSEIRQGCGRGRCHCSRITETSATLFLERLCVAKNEQQVDLCEREAFH